MSVYLDTSVVVPLFLIDSFALRARAFLTTRPSNVLVSDFVSAEFASVVGIRVRMKTLRIAEGRAAFANFDAWTKRYASVTQILASDIRYAEAMLRRLDLNLRAPDAIHIAIARRLGAELATFDTKLARSGRKLGTPSVVLLP